jgi:LysR family hydrogen peroxide-inducible transcriptional activator
MTLRELRYLVALAEHQHFGRAAEACHVTQPTLSAQLRKLEDYLGHTLVDREPKVPTLTPIGAQIVERARRLLAEADDILRLTRLRSGPLAGALNLGIIPTLAPYYLPTALSALRQAYPKLQLIVQEEVTGHLIAKLGEQLLDAALLALPTGLDERGHVEVPLFDEPFYVAAPLGHPLSALESVPGSALADQKLLLLTDGHCLRGQALEVCGLIEVPRDDSADCRATSLETLRQLVCAGLGCTLLPALAVRDADGDRLIVRPLAQGESRRIGLVWRRGHSRDAELHLLAEALKQALPDAVRPIR